MNPFPLRLQPLTLQENKYLTRDLFLAIFLWESLYEEITRKRVSSWHVRRNKQNEAISSLNFPREVVAKFSSWNTRKAFPR